VNADLFRKVDGQMRDLADKGVSCLFWHVPRDENGQADELANQALDELTSEKSSVTFPY